MSADNLTGQYISSTFRKILQLSDSGSYITDGTGSVVNILPTTASFALTASYVAGVSVFDTGSLLVTASIAPNSNTITFTKGNGSTFPITVHTGSGGGAGSGTASYSQTLGASLNNSINGANEIYLLNSDGSPLSNITVDNVANSNEAGVAVAVGVTSLQTVNRPNLWLAFIDSSGPNGYITVDTPVTYNSSSKLLNVTSSWSLTSSYYQETDPIFIAKSASLATTGSNIFVGNQTITGSLFFATIPTPAASKGAVYFDGTHLYLGV